MPQLDVTFMVAENSIKLTQGRIHPLIAPRVAPVLERDFIQLASLESVAEASKPTTVKSPLVFVTGPIDLVKVTIYNPLSSRWRLVGNELGEKILFAIASCWPIHRGQPEGGGVVESGESH